MTTPQATTKIVIVAGQEFSVPADTPNEAIRTQLTSMGFADVASATIQTGTRTIDGVETPTIEFVKNAGTKGLDAAGLAALLRQLAPIDAVSRTAGLTAKQRRLLEDLLAERLSAQMVLDAADELESILKLLADRSSGFSSQQPGGQLCQRLDVLPAVAASAPSAW